MEQIIDATHERDPRLAFQMARDFDRRMVRAEALSHIAPVQQQAYNQMLREVTQTLYQDPELGPDVKAYEQDVVSALKARGVLGQSAQEIHAAIVQELYNARGRDPLRSSAYQQRLAASKQNQAVEDGDGTPPPVQLSEAERIRERIFKKQDPSDFLLGPLSGLS
jgi:hypothetical protein